MFATPNSSCGLAELRPVPDWRKTLRAIAHELDVGSERLALFAGGVVRLGHTSGIPLTSQEMHDERQGSPRSAAGPREGPTGGQGSPGGAWTPGSASPPVVGCPAFDPAEIADVQAAYPGARFWNQADGGWVLTRSGLLEGSPKAALIATAISWSARDVKAWAFWDQGPCAPPAWIGPRHTNFNDGSICAFDPRDESAWRFGWPLTRLIDYYTLWAVRHLHLKTFGSWPGMQSVQLPYERILEFTPDELCGCGNSRTRYRDCCQPKDRARNQIALAIRHLLATNGGERHPPDKVIAFVNQAENPPSVGDILK